MENIRTRASDYMNMQIPKKTFHAIGTNMVSNKLEILFGLKNRKLGLVPIHGSKLFTNIWLSTSPT
jgi:hypothetical protein